MRFMDKKVPVKIVFILLAMICIPAITSCSNPNAGNETDGTNTLRNTADSISTNTKWTAELEAKRLTAIVNGADGMEKSITAAPDNVFASGNEKAYEPLYPEIPGFARLNTTLLDEGALQLIDSFCTAITARTDADTFMAKGSLYSLVLFLYDLDEKNGPVFKSYVLGEPFKNDDIFQCPIRFYYDTTKVPDGQQIGTHVVQKTQPNNSVPNGTTSDSNKPAGTSFEPHLDVYLYLQQAEGAWKIHQIEYDIEE